MSNNRIIVTGGSGLLGSELKKLLPGAQYPTSQEFDVSDFDQMEAYAESSPFEVVLHAAAFTSPPLIEKDPQRAISVNIIGTANVVRLCISRSARLIYISSDYVFRGDRGSYAEDDALFPVNRYAWSKLGGECAARMYDRSLIVRTTFGSNVFPYEKAFVDQWTSRESVSAIATKIVQLLDEDINGVIHVGGERRTVLEYARSLGASDVQELSTKDVGFTVPVDTSLDCSRFQHVVDDKGSKS